MDNNKKKLKKLHKNIPKKVIITDKEEIIIKIIFLNNDTPKDHAKGGDRYKGRAEGFRFSNQKLFNRFDEGKTAKRDLL